MTRLYSKIIHRGTMVDPDGNVSALCFRTPHAIDLRKASWTTRDEAVTCSKCQLVMKHREVTEREHLIKQQHASAEAM